VRAGARCARWQRSHRPTCWTRAAAAPPSAVAAGHVTANVNLPPEHKHLERNLYCSVLDNGQYQALSVSASHGHEQGRADRWDPNSDEGEAEGSSGAAEVVGLVLRPVLPCHDPVRSESPPLNTGTPSQCGLKGLA